MESTRPAMYRALKYWGKKPHNIWNEIICEYSKPNDIVFDPFAGSGLTFFECIKAGRFPIVSDINPLTNFLIDVYSSAIDYQQLNYYFDEILKRGFIDSYRYKNPQKTDAYTWWSYRKGVRERNIGWRIDYIILADEIKEKLEDCNIYTNTYGSDHCPIGIDINL